MYLPRIKIPLLWEDSKKQGHKRVSPSKLHNLPPGFSQKLLPPSAEPQACNSSCGREQD